MNGSPGPGDGDNRASATGDGWTGSPAAALGEALSTLSDPSEETAPGTEAHRSAAATLATLADERPAVVAGSVGTVWAAAERAIDAEEEWTTAERTDEQSLETLDAARASLVDALAALATERRAHPELVRATCIWLRDGNRRRLEAGLRLSERIADTDPRPSHLLTLAEALLPAAKRGTGGHGAVEEALDSHGAAFGLWVNDGRHFRDLNPSNWRLLGRIAETRDTLSETAVDALPDADPTQAVRDLMRTQGKLTAGTRPAVRGSAERFLEQVLRRELTEHAPAAVAAVSAAVLDPLDVSEDEQPGGVEQETAALAARALSEAARSHPEATDAYATLGRAAQSRPDLFDAEVASLVAVTDAVTGARTGRVLLKGIGAVADESPEAVAEHADWLAGLLRSARTRILAEVFAILILSDRNFHNRRVSRTDLATEFRPERPTGVHVLLSGSIRRVSEARPLAVAPHVDRVAERVEGSPGVPFRVDEASELKGAIDDQRLSEDAVGLFAAVAEEQPDAVLEVRDAVLRCLDAADDVSDAWLATLRELLGDAVDHVAAESTDADPESLVEYVDEKGTADDTTEDPSIEDCVSTLADALGVEMAATTDGAAVREAENSSGSVEEPPVEVGSSRPRPQTALWTLAEVAEDRPLALVPHLPLVARAVEEFEDPNRVSPALLVLSNVAKDYPESVANHVHSVVDALDPNAPGGVLTNALGALMSVANDRPEAVTTHLDRVVDVARTPDGEVRPNVPGTIANVARSEPTVVVDHLPVLIEGLGTGGLHHTAATVALGSLVDVRPGMVAEYVAEMVDSLDVNDPDGGEAYVLQVLAKVAGQEPEAVEPYVDRVGSLAAAEDTAVAAHAVINLDMLTRHDHETARPYLDSVAERLDEAVTAASTGETELTDGSYHEKLVAHGVGFLRQIAYKNPGPVRPHVSTLVTAVEESRTVRVAREAVVVLVFVAEEYPGAAADHVETIVSAAEEYDDPRLARAIVRLQEEIQASDEPLILSDRNFHNRRVSRTDLATEFRPERPTEVHVLLSGSISPHAVLGLLEYAVSTDLEWLVSEGDPHGLLWMAMYAAAADPDAAAEHAPVVADGLERVGPGSAVAASGVTLLALAAVHDPSSVAGTLSTAVAVLSATDDPRVASNALSVATAVATVKPATLVDHADALRAVSEQIDHFEVRRRALRAVSLAIRGDPAEQAQDSLERFGVALGDPLAVRGDPAELAPLVTVVGELLDEFDLHGAPTPIEIREGIRAIAAVAGHDPRAVGSHVDTVLESAATTGIGRRAALRTLSEVAAIDREVVVEEIETVLDLVEEASRGGVFQGGVALLAAGAVYDIESGHARRVGGAVARVDQSVAVLERLSEVPSSTDGLCQDVYVGLLDGVVASDECTPELAAAVETALVEVLDGEESPETIGAAADCLGRRGSIV